MNADYDHHLDVLKLAIQPLSSLLDELVFIGGATVSLHVTEPIVVSIRPTEDVDCVVEIGHRADYETLAKKLRALKFTEDMVGGVLCRFKKDSIILDVMPLDADVLGFTNKWYADGFKNAERITIANHEIQIFSTAFLIAAKLEAFKGRGEGNFRESHDIEDIVTIIDGRRTIAVDLANSPEPVRTELRKEFSGLLANSRFIGSLDAHISDRQNLEERKKIIVARIREFCGL
jgi:predicted nucleotidyltransferase